MVRGKLHHMAAVGTLIRMYIIHSRMFSVTVGIMIIGVMKHQIPMPIMLHDFKLMLVIAMQQSDSQHWCHQRRRRQIRHAEKNGQGAADNLFQGRHAGLLNCY